MLDLVAGTTAAHDIRSLCFVLAKRLWVLFWLGDFGFSVGWVLLLMCLYGFGFLVLGGFSVL